MTKESPFKNLLELNIAVLLISTSGALGRYIDLPVPVVTGLRAFIAVLLLLAFCLWKKSNFKIKAKDRMALVGSGILMAAHWITYFYALKYSNVAIGMLSLFTYPVITVLLEPLLLKTKFEKSNLFLGGLVVLGIYFLVPNFDVESTYIKAIGFGVLSAFCYALRNIIMKAKVSEYQSSVLMFYQLTVIVFLMFPFFFILDTSGVKAALPATLILGIVTTAIGHTFFVYSLNNFSTATASIIGSTQPVYGILIGFLFLQEVPGWSTLFGGLLILSSVVIESIRTLKKPPKKAT